MMRPQRYNTSLDDPNYDYHNNPFSVTQEGLGNASDFDASLKFVEKIEKAFEDGKEAGADPEQAPWLRLLRVAKLCLLRHMYQFIKDEAGRAKTIFRNKIPNPTKFRIKDLILRFAPEGVEFSDFFDGSIFCRTACEFYTLFGVKGKNPKTIVNRASTYLQNVVKNMSPDDICGYDVGRLYLRWLGSMTNFESMQSRPARFLDRNDLENVTDKLQRKDWEELHVEDLSETPNPAFVKMGHMEEAYDTIRVIVASRLYSSKRYEPFLKGTDKDEWDAVTYELQKAFVNPTKPKPKKRGPESIDDLEKKLVRLKAEVKRVEERIAQMKMDDINQRLNPATRSGGGGEEVDDSGEEEDVDDNGEEEDVDGNEEEEDVDGNEEEEDIDDNEDEEEDVDDDFEL
jgi:hypothetical protein